MCFRFSSYTKNLYLRQKNARYIHWIMKYSIVKLTEKQCIAAHNGTNSRLDRSARYCTKKVNYTKQWHFFSHPLACPPPLFTRSPCNYDLELNIHFRWQLEKYHPLALMLDLTGMHGPLAANQTPLRRVSLSVIWKLSVVSAALHHRVGLFRSCCTVHFGFYPSDFQLCLIILLPMDFHPPVTLFWRESKSWYRIKNLNTKKRLTLKHKCHKRGAFHRELSKYRWKTGQTF